ncbi:MAG: hypothetical protein GY851_01240 [bacterium]|nr:hypothetical protein [bacterium]
MSITYDTIMQDEIALLVSGRSYTNLTTEQKKLIDNGWTTGSVTGGAVKRALDSIGQWAAFFTMDSSAGIPDEWRTWLITHAAAGCAQRFTTADDRSIKTELSSARRNALTGYSRAGLEESSDTAHLLGSVLSIRQFVVSHCLRLAKPLLPEPYMIDEAMQEVLRDTWNACDWSFREQTVTLTIGTDSSVAVSGSLIIKRITSKVIEYSGVANKGNQITPVDGDMMLSLQAYEYAAGRPEYFRVRADAGGVDGGVRFDFERTPDQEYTAKAEAVTSIGPMTTANELGAVITAFPIDMVSYLKKKTLATVLENNSRHSDARPLEYECDQLLGDLIEQQNPLADTPMDEKRQFRRGLGRAPLRLGGFT